MAKIAVLGAGGWGTALAVTLAQDHDVTLWSLFEQEIADIRARGENTALLPGVPIGNHITLTSDISCAHAADLILMATPSFAVRETAARLRSVVKEHAIIVNLSKGIEYETLSLFSDVILQELPTAKVVILSGPSHAEEVSRGMPTTLVATSTDQNAAMLVQDLVMNDTLRVYTNDDITGVQLAGALKNIIAIASGCVHGLGLGDNTTAALITRGLTEIARLGKKMGAHESTFAGLTGVGDLIVTCTSQHSRNRQFGQLLGEGSSVPDALAKVGKTVEGYHAAKAAWALSKRERVEMPITEQCCHVMYEGKSARDAITALMARPKKHEVENPWL